MKSLTSQKKLGFTLVCGLLLGIGLIQIAILIEQFDPDSIKIDASNINYWSHIYVAILSIGLTILFLLEIKNLGEFHIDKFTIATFAIGLLIPPRADFLGGWFSSSVIRLLFFIIIGSVIIKKPQMHTTDIHWTVIGITTAGILVVFIIILELLIRPAWHPSNLLQNSIIPTVIGVTLKQFSIGVPMEEMLFRGFLWGYLRRFGWDERKIMWIQGLLFWFVHFSRMFAEPFTFFLVIPLITVLTSKLTSYAKQVFPSVVAHTLVNTVGALLNLATF